METRIAAIGLLANIALAAGKIAAGLLSRSSAVLAEGLHSGMDVISSGISLVGVRASREPVDEGHPYGHYKAEVIAGLFITMIPFMTAVWIIFEATISLTSPRTPVVGIVSVGVMAISAVINKAMARLKIMYGRKHDSLSLLSDGVHSRVDVFTSLAVLGGVPGQVVHSRGCSAGACNRSLHPLGIFRSRSEGDRLPARCLCGRGGRAQDQGHRRGAEDQNLRLENAKEGSGDHGQPRDRAAHHIRDRRGHADA